MQQRGADNAKHVVEPHGDAPYAWAESSLEHTLLVSLFTHRTDLISVPFSGGGGSAVTRQPVKLDAMMKSHKLANASGNAVAWAHVGMREGVHVITFSKEKDNRSRREEEPEEPHTFVGLCISGIGASFVHVGIEELLYVSLEGLTVDCVISDRSATLELQLHAYHEWKTRAQRHDTRTAKMI